MAFERLLTLRCRPMDTVDVFALEIEPGPAAEDGLSRRFKVAGERRVVRWVHYESEDGLDGRWFVWGTGDPTATVRSDAIAVEVEDSSEGTALLIAGGVHGLVLQHEASGRIEREPYVLLATHTSVG